MTASAPPGLNRQILALAVPALGALVAEPLFLLADSAIVGHLGVPQLAGLALASTVLLTAVGLSIFLAYGATAAVARRIGAGDTAGAVQHGIDGLWLGLCLGVAMIAVLLPRAPWWIGLLGGSEQTEALEAGVTYLRWSTLGLPAMLVVLASTGVLRGLQRTTPTLVVAVAGAAANIPLNVLFVYGLDWGIAGSAIGTVAVQWAMGAALAALVLRAAPGVDRRPSPIRIARSGRAGLPIFLRTLTLRTAMVLTVAVGAAKGEIALAGLQVTMNIWNLLGLALDAIAIAAQALTGRALGAGDADRARALTRKMLVWGVCAAALLGVLLAAAAPFAGRLFSTDPDVRAAIAAALVVIAVGMLVAGPVFVLDGVFLGAGDSRYLALSGSVTLVAYLPALAAVGLLAPDGRGGLIWLWAAYAGVFMTARLLTLGWRYRSARWLVLGAGR
ncbi:MAG: efflux family protein [Pseudonocardiales bacterium]|nr:efflux family protein [Pseudonocardiales bacterium]